MNVADIECLERFESLTVSETEEVTVCTAGVAKDGIAIGALLITSSRAGKRATWMATSPVGSEPDWSYRSDGGDALPPPTSALAAEWYALTFAMTHCSPQQRFRVYTATRPILDFLRGVAPFSRQPWLYDRQVTIAVRYAHRSVRIGGRSYARLQTRREAERKTRRQIVLTTSDKPLLIPMLASPAQVRPLLAIARERVEIALSARVQ